MLASMQLRGAVIWDYMMPLRRMARIYSWAFGWPLIVKGADYTMQGIRKVGDGIEWSGNVAKEAALGTTRALVAPPAMLAKSRLTMVKRMLWDVPIATASACIRTPIALALSPFRMIQGVRAAIASIPKNASELLHSVANLNVMDALKNTRKAITDVLLPPISKPLMPVLAPAGHLANVAIGANTQTIDEFVKGLGVAREGFQQVWDGPAVASARLHESQAVAQTNREANAKEKAAKKAAMAAKVAEDKGEAPLKKAA